MQLEKTTHYRSAALLLIVNNHVSYEMKTCTKCKTPKILDQFHKDRSKEDGLKSHCKGCNKAYNASHKEEKKAYNKTYGIENREGIASQKKGYYASHKSEIAARMKVYGKSYYTSHTAEVGARCKAYQKTDEGKKVRSKSRVRYPNAHKSRSYFTHRRPTPPDTCSICPSTDNIQAHHHDYDLPMEVTYLCKKCHVSWHSENTPSNRVTGRFTIP